jgi:hypothetical protein
MRIKFFAGVWDSWGFSIAYCHWYKGFTINLIHWYFGFEIWTKEEVEIASEVRKRMLTEEEYHED